MDPFIILRVLPRMADFKGLAKAFHVSHNATIPRDETQSPFYDEYLMQMIGVLADRLLADVRSRRDLEQVSEMRLTITLEKIELA